MRNPYQAKSEQERIEQERVRKEIELRTKNIAKLAKDCLDDPKFKKYRDEFEKYRDEILLKLNQPLDCDPIKDAHYLRACVNTLTLFSMILSKPKKDSKNAIN